jgi:hypothetical protein
MQNSLDREKQYDDINTALIESENAITKVFLDHFPKNTPLTYANFFGMGIGRRALALSSGFRSMVEQRNSLCALPIVRMQLDTSLRLYAGFFVSDHQKFCKEVFHGAQINKMKSHNGSVMTDKYLVDEVTKINHWMIDVYKFTSGYIHFSNSHILEALRKNENETMNAKMVIGPADFDREPKHFLEPMRCVHHLNLIIEFALKDWFSRMCSADGKVISASEYWSKDIELDSNQSYEDSLL